MAETDYLAQSSGHPVGYSRPFDYPFLAAEYQPLDPRVLEVHSCLSVTVSLDGAPMTGSYTVGPSDNVETALYGVASMLDHASGPEFHVFSHRNVIAVQALVGHTANMRSLVLSPYRPAASAWAVVPFDPPLVATKASVVVTCNGVARTFVSAPQVEAMAAEISKSPWLAAEPVSGGLKVSASAGLTLVVGGVSYE